MAFKMKAGKEGPMRKNFGDAVTPMNFNAGLRAASKAGKLDNNPKFKAAVDNAPMKKDKKSLSKRYADKVLSEGKTKAGKVIRKAHDFLVDTAMNMGATITGTKAKSMAEMRAEHNKKKNKK